MAWQTPFSAEEDQFIRKNWPAMGPSEIARHLGRSRCGVSRRVTSLGLRDAPCPNAPARVGHAQDPPAGHAPATMPPSLLGVASKGDEQKTLEALRDILAARIDETDSARDTASLAKRMIEVGERIAEVRSASKKDVGGQGAEVTSFDVIAGRNAGRRKAAQA